MGGGRVAGGRSWCPHRGRARKMWHSVKRVHRDQVSEEEWRVREAIAGLRDAHAEGAYL